MNKVVTINLNGRAYQLEESGYEALRTYLDEASMRLSDDPGKAEIVADLEQAIAEKCDKTLNPHKTVVSNDEIKAIIDEMGPVQGDAKEKTQEQKDEQKSGPRAPKRLFLIRQDAVFAGVCAGIAAYFDIDVTIVRIAFIALTIFTGGIWILLYLALALFVPYADTAEDLAQARGELFNAETLVQRAKERWSESYERVTGDKWDTNSDLADAMKIPADALKNAHEQHLKWRMMKKQQRQQWKQQWKAQRYANRHPNPAMGFLLGALGLMWVLALLSLISSGAIFGWPIPAGVPLWVAVVLLFVVFQALTGPLRGAGHGYWDGSQYHYRHDPWDGFFGVLTAIFLVTAFVWAYRDIPQFYLLVHHPIAETKVLFGQLKAWWNK